MSRNVTIVVIILIVVVLAAYLVWLRGKYEQTSLTPAPSAQIVSPTPSVTPSLTPSPSASQSASPSASVKKVGTPSGVPAQ